MKRFLLYFLCCIVADNALAQQAKQSRIPEFAKMPAENRYDSINAWYVHNVYLPPVDKSIAERSLLMMEARAYADHSNDMATKASMAFFTGHFISGFERDSARGMHYIIEAFNIAEKYSLQYEWASYTLGLGLMYRDNNKAKSLESLTRAIEVMDRVSVPNKIEVLYAKHILGTLYFHLGNYGACIQTLIPVLNGLEGRAIKIDLIQANNTVGLAYREIGDNDSALFYFRKVLASAEAKPVFPSWIGIAAGNIGSVYLKQHQLDSALIYALKNYDLVKDDPNVSGVGVAEALVLLSTVYLEQHKTDQVISLLSPAEKLITAKQIYYSYNVEYLLLKVNYILARAYHDKGDQQTANIYIEKALKLQKELSHKDNEEIYTRVQQQLEAEKNISKVKETESAMRLLEQRKNFFIAGLCFIGLILLSLTRRQRIRNKKNKQLFESRERLLLLEKKRAEENLLSYMENLQEKNKLIEHVEQEIVLLEAEKDNPEKLEVIETFNKLKRSTIITNEHWVQFKILFEKTYEDFFEKLKKKFPDITQAEMRMMALMKLDIPTRKMADMLGISPESIRKTQYRFIKKIDATGKSDLTKIVNSL